MEKGSLKTSAARLFAVQLGHVCPVAQLHQACLRVNPQFGTGVGNIQIAHGQLPDAGDITGQYWLGYCYEHGVGTAKDMNQAVRWYQKSAVRGDHVSQPAIDALNRLGVKTN